MKILSRRSVGQAAVYDIGVEQDHNFLLRGGWVASNCFNKSHSTAYGFVTFQTAYLKAHYPTEYMAALLSSVGGDHEKLQRYIAYCMAIGIEVLPPDVNRSGLDFTPLTQKIVFGLGAVKNIGDAAIESILQSREEGPFVSLADFCGRVDLHTVNRRGIEALICAGAFDRIEPNRKQLMDDLELVINWATDRAKAKKIGQASLFDLLSTGGESPEATPYADAPHAPPTADYSPQEKLKLEKELLGLYVSDHPLKRVAQQAHLLAPVPLGRVADLSADTLVNVLALIMSIKRVTTKKGDRMAILQLEDLTGSCEAVVFPKTFEKFSEQLLEDQQLLIWAKVDQRDEQVQLILQDMLPVESVQYIQVRLPAQQAGDIQFCYQLQALLTQLRGESEEGRIPVVALITQGPRQKAVRLGGQFRVRDAQATVQALQQAGFQAEATGLCLS